MILITFLWYTRVSRLRRMSDRLLKGPSQGSALHYACYKRDHRQVQCLVRESPDQLLEEDRYGGALPLHYACEYNNLDIVKTLMSVDEGRQAVNCRTLSRLAMAEDLFYINDDTIGFTPLHLASYNGCVDIVRYLISKEDCDLNSRDRVGNTPLHLACEKGHLEVVQCLVDMDCDINVRNCHSDAPLHIAYGHGHLDIVKFLVSNKECDVNIQRWDKNSVLHLACERGHMESIQCLVGKHCNVNLKNCNGDTPMHIACSRGHLGSLTLLLSQKECDLNSQDINGNTLLHLVCDNGHLGIAQYLTDKHCDVNLKNKAGNAPIHTAYGRGNLNIVRLLISQEQCDVNTQNKDGNAPLHITCKKGHLQIAQSLTNKHCDVNLRNNRGKTAIHIAIQHHNFDIARLLISPNECDINIQDEDGNTPLHVACDIGSHLQVPRISINHADSPPPRKRPSIALVQLLMNQENCQVNIHNKDRDTALHLACEDGRMEVVQCLVESGSDINVKNWNGNSPVHVAYTHRHFDIARLLVHTTHCAINSQNRHGQAILHLACEKSDLSTVSDLISLPHCNVNIMTSLGNTPLHLACQHGSHEIVKVLLVNGKVDPTYTNLLGMTAIELTDITEIISDVTAYVKANEHPLESFAQVFVIGDESTGKTTLIEILFQGKTKLSPKKHTVAIKTHTAGMITCEVHSKKFGSVLVYDCAGQRDYHTNHSAVMETLTSPVFFIVVIDLREEKSTMMARVFHWLSLIDNHCATPSHVVVVGSHLDMAERRGVSLEETSSIIQKAISTFQGVHFIRFIALDCRKFSSRGRDNLRSILAVSCSALRGDQNLYFGCHSLYTFLHDKFKVACRVSEIASCIEGDMLMPPTTTGLIELLSSLSDRGLLLVLRNTSCPEQSWVILDKNFLLSEIIGIIFAPPSSCGYQSFSTSTGVVPLSKIKGLFPKYNSKMIVGILEHLQFCQKIRDPTSLSLSVPEYRSCSEERFLFPALVQIESPVGKVWRSWEAEYRFGWCLRCTDLTQYLTSRFLHVLLLRLAFSFAPEISSDSTSCSTMWKNGIQWLTESGVEIIVEVLENYQSLVLMARCKQGEVVSCAKIRSAVIEYILTVKKELCPKVQMNEFIINPTELSFPPKNTEHLSVYSIKDIAEMALSPQIQDVSGKPYMNIVDYSGMDMIDAEELLGFEPYLSLGNGITNRFFSEKATDIEVTESFLMDLAEQVHTRLTQLMEYIKHHPEYFAAKPASRVGDEVQQCFYLFRVWCEQRGQGEATYDALRRDVFDSFSIFCGRNIAVSLLHFKFTFHYISVSHADLLDLASFHVHVVH